MRFLWLGGPSFLLQLGEFRVLGDPVFGSGEPAFVLPRGVTSDGAETAVRRLAPLPDVSMDGIDRVVLTRNRPDHFDGAARERIGREVAFVAPTGSVAALRAEGFSSVYGIDWGGVHTVEKGPERLTISAVAAFAPLSGEGTSPESCGFILCHEAPGGSYTVYWSGDTVWTSEARALRTHLERLDLFIVNLGAIGAGTKGGATSLTGKDAMQYVFLLRPKRIVPVGHHTFSHYEETVDDFKKRADLTLYDRRLMVLDEGDVFEHERGGTP